MYDDSSLSSVHNNHKEPRFQTKEEYLSNQIKDQQRSPTIYTELSEPKHKED